MIIAAHTAMLFTSEEYKSNIRVVSLQPFASVQALSKSISIEIKSIRQ